MFPILFHLIIFIFIGVQTLRYLQLQTGRLLKLSIRHSRWWILLSQRPSALYSKRKGFCRHRDRSHLFPHARNSLRIVFFPSGARCFTFWGLRSIRALWHMSGTCVGWTCTEWFPPFCTFFQLSTSRTGCQVRMYIVVSCFTSMWPDYLFQAMKWSK